MLITDKYDEQLKLFIEAFEHRGGCCTSVECEACGRTHFVTEPGHGDYEPGELEALVKAEQERPDKFCDWGEFGTIDTVDLDGRHLVPGCPCDPCRKHIDWIVENRSLLSRFLKGHWESEINRLKNELGDASAKGDHVTANQILRKLGF